MAITATYFHNMPEDVLKIMVNIYKKKLLFPVYLPLSTAIYFDAPPVDANLIT